MEKQKYFLCVYKLYMATVGLILSGGASKCIAHLGVIKALNEIGVKLDYISAVSGGALLGSLIASGVSPEDTLEIIVKRANFSYYFPSFRSGGLFSMSRIQNLYEEILPVRTFEKLSVPMAVVATDVNNGQATYFTEGELVLPVIASSSYPIIFEPVEIQGKQYLDGGIVNNFPVEIMEGKVDVIIGSYVGSICAMDRGSSLKRMMFRSLSLAIGESDKPRLKKCDLLLVSSQLGNYPMFEFENAKEIYKIGYQETIKNRHKLEALLQ